MLKELIARIRQGHKTIEYPGKEPVLPEHYRGLPVLDQSRCPSDCTRCMDACPTSAIQKKEGRLELDLGKCLFCTDCKEACVAKAVSFSQEFRLARNRRSELEWDGGAWRFAEALGAELKSLFGRSLRLRQVSAGGCNACELDTNVLGTVVFDLSRFGIQFVASPRHADGLFVTGPVSENMKLALQKAYDALPAPKLVIAAGACAISGGPYIGHKEVNNGVGNILPVDLYIPGCPPHPLTILDGLLRLLGRIANQKR